jgi:DEAD/DEAH box helicase domain-containing protein
MCDPRDLGIITEVRASETKAPTVTLYDRIPEGLGFSERLYDLHHELLTGCLDLIGNCRCSDGCPACVGPIGPGGSEVKTLTIRLLEALIKDRSSAQS